ncbi:MAG: SanA/YdcF family protein [Bacteroidales bacterium]
MIKKLKYFIAFCLFFGISALIINIIVISKSKKFIYSEIGNVPECYTAIVLGAHVSESGYLSNFLQDRLDVAIELYKNKKIKRFLLSGDHGRSNYDEVNSMKHYLLNQGIDSNDVFLDHAGFDTYSSIVRAKEVFGVNKTIIVSQEFHLPRAVFIARSKGLDAFGMKADKRIYSSIKHSRIREIFANIKAVLELIINKSPRFLGAKIPITGDSKLSYD